MPEGCRRAAGATLLAALLGLGPAAPAQTRGAQGRRLDDYLRRLTGFGYSGAVLVALDGQVVLREGYGFADRERRVPNRPETLFDIGSLAKSFTAVAVLRLEAEGRLRVEQPLSRFLPQAPEDKRSLTLHQLLTHTSGVTGPDLGYRVIGSGDALREILARPLAFPPGSRWAYSNAGYVLLAAVVEAASGTTYQDYLASHVFRPAGLVSTGFWGRRLPRRAASRTARGYDELGPVTELEQLSPDTWNDIGSGQIVSTVDDLYRWQQSLESHRSLTAAALAKMLTPAFEEAPSDDYYNGSYGYGIWAQRLADGTRRYHHGGDFLGFGSQLTWLPERKTVIVSLCNVRDDLYPVHRRADRAIPALLSGAQVEEPPRFATLGRRELDRMTGAYGLPTGGTLTVSRGVDGLSIGAEGQDAALLLDGHFDQAGALAARGEAARELLAALLRGDDSGLATVGLGDEEARRDIRAEIEALGAGLGRLKTVRNIGTCLGGLLGRFESSILRAEFERGSAYYKMQWNGATIAGTSARCPHLAAATRLQPRSARELVGWNLVTQKGFTLRFGPGFEVVTVLAGDRQATAVRVQPAAAR